MQTTDPDRLGYAPNSLQLELKRDDFAHTLALFLPLIARLGTEPFEAAVTRLLLLAAALVLAWMWTALLTKKLAPPSLNQAGFALLFAVMLPGPVGYWGAALAVSFGWVFGYLIFGGKPILPAALVALAFAIYSFPGAGYELTGVLTGEPGVLLAASCLPGTAWMLWKKKLPVRIVVGVLVGAALISTALSPPDAPSVLEHVLLGSFALGILFIATRPEAAPQLLSAQWAYGALIGGLIVTLRITNPDHPDGVVLAILIAGLFSPLLDRLFAWRLRHD